VNSANDINQISGSKVSFDGYLCGRKMFFYILAPYLPAIARAFATAGRVQFLID
jgi:hypothetical protein